MRVDGSKSLMSKVLGPVERKSSQGQKIPTFSHDQVQRKDKLSSMVRSKTVQIFQVYICLSAVLY